MSSDRKNGKRKKKDEKEEERITKKLAFALTQIHKFEILNLTKVVEKADIKWRKIFPTKPQMVFGSSVEEKWRNWITHRSGLKPEKGKEFIEAFKKSGVIPHGVPITYFFKKKELRYAFIHHWMKEDVRVTEYCHEALEGMQGTYLVYFLPIGSHIIDPRFLNIEVVHNKVDNDNDNDDGTTKKQRNLDDTFFVTETSWRNGLECQRAGPLIPFKRFHSVTLVPSPKPQKDSVNERANGKDKSDNGKDEDSEFLVIQDEGGGEISGTFQFKGAIGRFRGRKQDDSSDSAPSQKRDPIPLDSLSRQQGIDDKLADDLLNDLNVNSFRSNP